MDNWYLVYCKARQEDLAANGLEEQGYAVYLPKLRTRRRRAGGAVDVVEPLFPRYLFVASFSAEQSISPAQYTIGVQKLIRFGQQFLPVPESVVAALKEREDPATGSHSLTLPNMKRGDRVRIRSGAFAGIEGVFDVQSGRDRIIVLLELLGQQTKTEIPMGELAL